MSGASRHRRGEAPARSETGARHSAKDTRRGRRTTAQTSRRAAPRDDPKERAREGRSGEQPTGQRATDERARAERQERRRRRTTDGGSDKGGGGGGAHALTRFGLSS